MESAKQLKLKDFGVTNLKNEILEYSPVEIHAYRKSEDPNSKSGKVRTYRRSNKDIINNKWHSVSTSTSVTNQ